MVNRVLRGFAVAGRQAFRTREFAALIGESGYARVLLHRLKERGELVLARRGWWAFGNALPEAVACELSWPCFVSFHSALFLHGLTSQVPRFVQLAVARNARRYSVLGVGVREFRVGREAFNCFSQRDGLFLASPEKAVADCFCVPRACPEVVLVEALAGVDLDVVRALVLKRAGLKRLERLAKRVA